MSEREQLEKEMSEALTEGKMESKDPDSNARDRLIPKYEIRIPATADPIVEETRIVRSMAEEVDDRYDEYLSRIPKSKNEKGSDSKQ